MNNVIEHYKEELSLNTDGWTNPRGGSIINYVLIVRVEALFVKSQVKIYCGWAEDDCDLSLDLNSPVTSSFCSSDQAIVPAAHWLHWLRSPYHDKPC